MSDSNETPPGTEWFYQLLGLATGPVSAERLQWLVENNHLAAASMIGRSASGPWQRLDESEFLHLVPDAARATRLSSTADSLVEKKPVRIPAEQPASSGFALRSSKDEAVPADPVTDSPKRPGQRSEPEFTTQKTHHTNKPVVAGDNQTSEVLHDDLEVVDEPNQKAAWDAFEAGTQPEASTQPEPAAPEPERKRVPVAVPEPSQKTIDPPRKTVTSPRKTVDPERRKKLIYAAGGIAGLVLLFFVARLFFGGAGDGSDAFATFRRVADGIATNGKTMDDTQWVTFLNSAKTDVANVLEPLRTDASAERPKLQALVWAGDHLLSMLQGSREFPPGTTAKFEAFMSEYSGAPFPKAVPTDAATDEDVEQNTDTTPPVTDPVFR